MTLSHKMQMDSNRRYYAGELAKKDAAIADRAAMISQLHRRVIDRRNVARSTAEDTAAQLAAMDAALVHRDAQIAALTAKLAQCKRFKTVSGAAAAIGAPQTPFAAGDKRPRKGSTMFISNACK